MGPVEALLATIADQVARLPRPTVAALAPVLQAAQKELERDLAAWLANAPGGAARFTAQHYRNALVQIRGALEAVDKMEPKVVSALVAGSNAGGKLAVGHLEAELETFGRIFQHSVRPIALGPAAVIARGDRLLIPRFRTSAARYVGDVRSDIQRQLALGVLRGENFDQLKSRLIRLGGPKGAVALRGVLGDPGAQVEFISEGLFKRYGHWAERVARTEVINAYNTHVHTGLDAFAEEDEGALKRWDATNDRRVCLLCRELDGKMAEVGGAFPGGFRHPPAHPNCRCAVVAWHKEWTEEEVYGGRQPVIAAPPQVRAERTPTGVSITQVRARKKAPPVPAAPAAAPPPGRITPQLLAARERDMRGPHGAGLASDGDLVENSSLNFRRVLTETGKEVTEVTFKVTSQYEDRVRELLGSDAKREFWHYRERGLVKGRMVETGGSTSTRMNVLKRTLRTGETYELGLDGAVKNQVRLRFSGSVNDGGILAILQGEFGKPLGADLLTTPTAAQVQLQAKAKLLAKWSPGRYSSFVVEGERGETFVDSVEKLHGILLRQQPEYKALAEAVLSTVELREVTPGHVTLYSSALADAAKKSKIYGLYHDMSQDVDRIASVVENGLASSTARYERGLFLNGQSTGADFETGGAHGVFTRIGRAEADQVNAYGGCRVAIRPEELGRLDFWAFDQDDYGRSGYHAYERRMGLRTMLDPAHRLSSANEVMMPNGIPSTSFQRVIIRKGWDSDNLVEIPASDLRESVLSKLRERGIVEVGGVKIEDLIVTDKR